VPTSPEPDRSEPTEAAAPPVMPGSVRIAAIAMGVLASLLLVRAGVLWYGFDSAVHELTSKQGVSRAEAGQLVLVALIPSLVMGLILALAAWFLPRRQAWARWIGLGASTLIALLTLFSLVAAGGITVSSLLLFVLAAAAVAGLLARPTSGWVPSLGARR
jgi:hypothetical protein